MKKIIASALIIIIVLIGGSLLYLSKADVTPISHHWENYKSWHKTSGNKPITGATPFLDEKHAGTEGYRVIYINKVGEAVNKGTRPFKYPEGTVLVKEQYADKGSFESGKKPELNIMIKLADKTSPQTGDWGYVTFFRRKIHMGKSKDAKFCGGCHKVANLKKNDFVFINSSTHQSK